MSSPLDPSAPARAAALLLVIASLAGCGREPAGPSHMPPPTVTVATPVQRDITEYYHYTGTTEAVEDVEIRARVGGFLESVHFEPSTNVRKGALLFRIEQGPYKAAVDAAKAEVARAEAVRDSQKSQFGRVQRAFDKKAASEVERIEAEAAFRESQANFDAAKAKFDQANIDLGYTEIHSPIEGRISRKLVSIGDLVGQGEPTLLTNIVQVDPIWVYVDVSERIVLEYLKRGRDGTLDRERDVVEMALANDPDGEYPHKGYIDYVDNRVDEATGTIRVRGKFPNEGRGLFPGLFARVRVPYDKIEDAVLIRRDAVASDLGGKYALTVADDGTVAQARLTLGPEDGDYIVVREGLGPDDRYIVAGIQKARPGSKVKYETAKPKAPAPAPKPADE